MWGMLQMTLKRQNVSSERVCLFATVWKCAVYKFTDRYTKLFCAGRPPLLLFLVLFLFSGGPLLFLLVILSSLNITAHQEQKRKLTNLLFCFLYSAFESVHLCAPLLYRSVCLYGTHTDTLEQIKVDVLISYFLYP